MCLFRECVCLEDAAVCESCFINFIDFWECVFLCCMCLCKMCVCLEDVLVCVPKQGVAVRQLVNTL